MEKITFHTEQRKISELIPAPYNPRKMTEEQAAQLTRSLEKFDLAEIPVINTDNMVLAGHQRLKILYSLGRGNEVIDVRIPNRLLSEEECKEYNIRSNKNTGEWDFELLGNNFDTEMLLDIGFTELQLGMDVIPEPEDVIPEIPTAEPKSQLGDMYEFNGHRVLCGDSTNTQDVARLMNDEKADMVFTDPPYNVAYVGKTKEKLTIKNDSKSAKDFTQFCDDFIGNLLTFCRGAMYICMSSSEWGTIQSSFIRLGGHWSRVIIWVKDRMVLSRADYHTQFEPIAVVNDEENEEGTPILYGWKEGEKRTWNGDRKQTDIWNVKRPNANKEHPTMKPVELCARAIKNSSERGMIVMDLFLGSGSTLIACEKIGRRCYGMELDPIYLDVIISRWCKYTGNTKVLKNGKEIEWVV